MLISGMTMNLIPWTLYQTQALTEAGYKVVVFDNRDAGKTKKPYHLPLTKNTKSRLTKMAQVQGLSETAMLETLINRSYELDYVNADGKDLY